MQSSTVSDKAALRDLVVSRRSVSPKRLIAPGPTPAEVEEMVRAAVAAPDHKGLRPVRFVVIPTDRRHDLARAFIDAKRERDPAASEDDLRRAGEKAFRGPLLIAIVLRIERDHPRVSVSDQMMTAGAAAQNMLLTAAALGYGACLRSGASATSRKVRQALGIAASEELAAFMIVGTSTETTQRARVIDISGMLENW